MKQYMGRFRTILSRCSTTLSAHNKSFVNRTENLICFYAKAHSTVNIHTDN